MEREPNNDPVPKFSSFKPKAKHAESHNPPPASERSPKSSRALPSSSHRDDHKEISHSNYDILSSKEGRYRRLKRASTTGPLTYEAGTSSHRSSDLRGDFTIDTGGDDDNVRYGSLHKYSVPQYRRSGNGNVLGLSLRQKIDRDLSSDRRIVIGSPDSSFASGKDIKQLSKFGIRKDKEVRIKPDLIKAETNIDVDFLPFQLSTQFQESNVGASGEEDSDGEHYRSIHGKFKPGAEPADKDFENVELINSVQAFDGTDSSKGINSKVEGDPSDGQAWLDLIEHQGLQYGNTILTKDESLSLADIRLSIIEKALKQVKSDYFREILLSDLMKQGSFLWDTIKVVRKWEELLEKNPHYISLWTQYINFLQTSFVSFHYEDLIINFRKAFSILDSSPRSGSNMAGFVRIRCYLLLRMTLLMRESGYYELAIAIWQANLEFNLFRPDSLQDHIYDHFEKFWDSEVARIGEEDSVGWNAAPNEESIPTSLADEFVSGSDTDIRTWLHVEEDAEKDRFPGRTLDNTREDDPYRVVLFSDIRPFLFDVTDSIDLITAFLAFYHIPPPMNVEDSLRCWWWDSFVRNGFSSCLSKISPNHELVTLDCFITTPDTILKKSDQAWSQCPADNNMELNLVRNTLIKLLSRHCLTQTLSQSSMYLEYTRFPGSSRKAAKRLLKHQSSNLELYNAYAVMEFRQGHKDIAENVLATAINMSKSIPESILLWETWIWETLENNLDGPEAALLRLLTMSEDHISSQTPTKPEDFSRSKPSMIIRVHHLLTSFRDHHLSIDSQFSIYYITLHFLLTYLSSADPDPLNHAIATFNASISLLPLPAYSRRHELLHQSLARLISYHIAHFRSFSRRVVSAVLQSSVTLFPQNTICLHLFASVKSRFRIDSRARDIVSQKLILSSDRSSKNHQLCETVVTHTFAIYNELQMSNLGANDHSVRAAFERAVVSDSGGKSAFIWKEYVMWEWSRTSLANDDTVAKVRGVWWRAIRACPWVKALWVMPWQLEGIFGEEDLKGIFNLMRDKEIRIRVNVD